MSSDEFSEEDLISSSESASASEVGDIDDEYQGNEVVRTMMSGRSFQIWYAQEYNNRQEDNELPPSAGGRLQFYEDNELVYDTRRSDTFDTTKFRKIPRILEPRNIRLRKDLVLSKSVEEMVNKASGDEMVQMYNHIRSIARTTDVDTYRTFYKDLSEVILLRMHIPWFNWPKVDKSSYTKEVVIDIIKKYNKGTFEQSELTYTQTRIAILQIFNDRKTRDSVPLIINELTRAREEINNVQNKRRSQANLICEYAFERLLSEGAISQQYPIEEIPWDPVIPKRPDISKYFIDYPGDACKGTTDVLEPDAVEKIKGGSTPCVVCTNVADVLQRPCAHCIYCIDCVKDYYKTDIRLNCSVCRENVDKFEYLRAVYKRKRE